MDAMPPVDIWPDLWPIVRDILRRHVPQYDVWAFGSRAMGTTKRYADLDLAVITDRPLPLKVRAHLADAFSESDLPRAGRYRRLGNDGRVLPPHYRARQGGHRAGAAAGTWINVRRDYFLTSGQRDSDSGWNA
jgi:hypothetical protein